MHSTITQHSSFNTKRVSRGFTLIELLLTVSLLSVIAGFGVPIYHSFYAQNELQVMTQSVAQSFRRAQVLAQASTGDTSWGVFVQSGSVVVFQGASYAARAGSLDEVFTTSAAIVPSGHTEVVFDVFTGEPQSTGTTTLTSNTGHITEIYVNGKGTVEY